MPFVPANVWSWLHRVFAWDGVLPVCVALLPTALKLIAPNKADAISVAAVIVPIGALIVRYNIGRRHITSNNLPPAVKAFQQFIFSLAILWLCLLDSFLITMHFGVRPPREPGEWLLLAMPFGPYFVAMLIAMFPGRRHCRTPRSRIGENKGVSTLKKGS